MACYHSPSRLVNPNLWVTPTSFPFIPQIQSVLSLSDFPLLIPSQTTVQMLVIPDSILGLEHNRTWTVPTTVISAWNNLCVVYHWTALLEMKKPSELYEVC